MNILASSSILLIGGGVVAIIAVALCVFFLTRKKRSDEPQMIHDDIEKIVDEQAKKKSEENSKSKTEKSEKSEKPNEAEETKIVYSEPKEYFPKKVRKEYKLGEYAQTQKRGEAQKADKSEKSDKPVESPNNKPTEKTNKPVEKTAPQSPVTEAETEEKTEGAVRESAVRYRVIFDKNTHTWIIKKDNAKRVIRRVRTKEEAMRIAKELSKNQETALVVHKKDGKFQKK
ncbi:MAG: DUF2188 domain-containing protein [Clostridia bacterium]|nr:DUF2188 domain-containing protein [Clostridia bacterium]